MNAASLAGCWRGRWWAYTRTLAHLERNCRIEPQTRTLTVADPHRAELAGVAIDVRSAHAEQACERLRVHQSARCGRFLPQQLSHALRDCLHQLYIGRGEGHALSGFCRLRHASANPGCTS